MKNIPVLLALAFSWVMGGPTQAYALFYSPYPHVLSQPINILPYGYVTINVGYETYYYYNGVFYQKIMRDQEYVAVSPPVGAVVFMIPQGYRLMLLDETPYYEYQGVYYKRVLEGYKVIFPPV